MLDILNGIIGLVRLFVETYQHPGKLVDDAYLFEVLLELLLLGLRGLS
jgi:hypothetical protein